MENSIVKRKIKLTISILIIMLGIYLLSYSYFNTKKIEIFDEVNEQYYARYVHIENEITEIEESDVVTEEIAEESDEEVTAEKPKVSTVDYTKYYIGYLSIPKLDFKKGFTKINNRYNNVNRNIEVLKQSDMPNVAKGNLMIAAHSGNGHLAFFKNLYKLKLGDEAYITYNNEKYKYVIKNIYTAPKTGVVKIKRNPNIDTLTLITCTKNDNSKQTVYILEKE